MLPATEKKSDLSDIFECKRCGYCCHGETTVSLDRDDQKRMIECLDMEDNEVRNIYWRTTGNVVQMEVVDGHCIFYEQKTGCSVHKGRPWRCRQWPLHPSILSDENNFEIIRGSCPGMNKKISYSEFCSILKQLGEDNTLYSRDR